eukprot:gene29073-38130_t
MDAFVAVNGGVVVLGEVGNLLEELYLRKVFKSTSGLFFQSVLWTRIMEKNLHLPIKSHIFLNVLGFADVICLFRSFVACELQHHLTEPNSHKFYANQVAIFIHKNLDIDGHNGAYIYEQSDGSKSHYVFISREKFLLLDCLNSPLTQTAFSPKHHRKRSISMASETCKDRIDGNEDNYPPDKSYLTGEVADNYPPDNYPAYILVKQLIRRLFSNYAIIFRKVIGIFLAWAIFGIGCVQATTDRSFNPSFRTSRSPSRSPSSVAPVGSLSNNSSSIALSRPHLVVEVSSAVLTQVYSPDWDMNGCPLSTSTLKYFLKVELSLTNIGGAEFSPSPDTVRSVHCMQSDAVVGFFQLSFPGGPYWTHAVCLSDSDHSCASMGLSANGGVYLSTVHFYLKNSSAVETYPSSTYPAVVVAVAEGVMSEPSAPSITLLLH